ncbi:major facilitator superfamily protein, partial [Kipferlia bialata]
NALAIFNIVQLFSSPIWHRISDKIGRKPSMVIISLNYAGCFVGFALSTSYGGILFFRALSGVGAIYAPLGNTICADITPMRQRAKALAYLNGACWVGCFAGIILNMILGKMGWEWKQLMFLGAFFSFMGAMVSLFFLRESAPIRIARTEADSLSLDVNSAPKESGFVSTIKVIRKNKNLMIMFIGYTFTLGSHSFFQGMAGGIVNNHCGLDSDDAGYLYSWTVLLFNAAGVLGSVIVGPLSKKFGEKMVIHIGQACSVFAIGYCATDPDGVFNYYIYTFCCVLNGIQDGLAHPSFLHFCSEWSSPEDRGMMLGLFQIGNSLGRSVFMLVQGYIFDWDNHVSWVIALIYPVIGIICTIVPQVPLERHQIEAEIRKRAAEQEDSNLDRVVSQVPV